MGKIYYVMGKSASGKDTIYKRLVKKMPELGTVRMYTTRPIRDGETNGVEYIFTDAKQLQAMKDAGKVIECRTYDTIYGPWSYFTADDGQIDLGSCSYLMMGTLESYEGLCKYYGAEVMVPLYIHVEDGVRLQRALNRENTQKNPKYAEMCRRFLADEKDFSKERLDQCGIIKQYENTGIEPCIEEIIKDILCNEGKEKQMLKKIGFIGVGIMGKSMVRNLMKAGYEVSIYTRTKSKVEDVIAEGAAWCDTVADCSKGKDVVITIVGYPKDVEEVYFGEDGILENADKGTYLIDMTTTSPKLDQQIYHFLIFICSLKSKYLSVDIIHVICLTIKYSSAFCHPVFQFFFGKGHFLTHIFVQEKVFADASSICQTEIPFIERFISLCADPHSDRQICFTVFSFELKIKITSSLFPSIIFLEKITAHFTIP